MEEGRHESVTEKVRRELARRGWSLADLATRMNWHSSSTLRNLLCGNNASPRARHRCEQALGVPIWSRPEAFERRRVAIAFFAADPHTLHRIKLEALARRHLRAAGQFYTRRPTSGLRARLEDFAVQNYQPAKEEAR